MLTAEGCLARRKRLFDRLPEKPDVVVIADPQHQMYFANYWQSPFVFRSVDAGAILLLTRDGGAVLVADNLLTPFAEAAHVVERVLPVWYRSVESAPHREGFLAANALARLLRFRPASVGYEEAQVPAAIIDGLRAAGEVRLSDVSGVIREMKRSKDADEVALLNRTMRAAEAGHAAALRNLAPGMTELDAFLLVRDAVTRAAGEPCELYGDFASGPRAEEGGGPPTKRVINKGDLFILDFSVVLYQYRCDFSNTFAVGGRPTERQRGMFSACIDAMAAGEAQLCAGVSARQVDAAVRGAFAARNLDKTFPHHAGHGIGLGHPESPYLVPQSSDILTAGDVVTLEPGNYIAGVGGMRYERNYLITEAGFEILSRHALAIEA